jgi:hypothetical protein
VEPQHLAVYRESEARASQQFRDVIDGGIAEGIFLTPYPEDARRAVIAMCNAISQWYDAAGPLDVEDLVGRYVSLALTLVEYRPRTVRRPVRG